MLSTVVVAENNYHPRKKAVRLVFRGGRCRWRQNHPRKRARAARFRGWWWREWKPQTILERERMRSRPRVVGGGVGGG
jgi:hypothetical protein